MKKLLLALLLLPSLAFGDNAVFIPSPSSLSDLATWAGGTAITASSYQVGRDADGTNQLHFNVPTGATFEWSVNDAAEMTLSSTAVNFQNNSLTTTGGGSLTGTWSNLGTVTTIDINGGTVDGAAIGASSASTGAFTTITATSTIRSTATADLGWSIVNAANQACNTTCTNACVFGFNTGALGNLLPCTDATADSCVCAGAN